MPAPKYRKERLSASLAGRCLSPFIVCQGVALLTKGARRTARPLLRQPRHGKHERDGQRQQQRAPRIAAEYKRHR
ncbi:MAG: hypothetical protein ABI268_12305 [Rhodanobacter sp.]